MRKAIITWILACACITIVQAQVFNITYNQDYTGDWGMSVIEKENSFYIGGVGYAEENDGWRSLFFLKFDNRGRLIYNKIYGKKGVAYHPGTTGSLIKTKDDGFAIGGSCTNYNIDTIPYFYLVKFNADGDTLFTRTYKSKRGIARQVRQLKDGGYILSGDSYNASTQEDIYIIRTDSAGNKLWEKTYGGGDRDVGLYLELTNDNGFLISGYASYGNGIYVLKLDSNGNELWDKTINVNLPRGGGAFPLNKGGYILYSAKDTGDGNQQGYIGKLSDDGSTILWERTYGTDKKEYFGSVRELANGELIIAGESNTGVINDRPLGWLVRTDSLGNLLWENKYFTYPDKPNFLREVELTQDGGIIATGSAWDSSEMQSIWLLKTDSLGNTCDYGTSGCDSITSVPVSTVKPAGQIKVYPNPAGEQFIIESDQPGVFSLYNLLGSLIKEVAVAKGRKTITTSGLPEGVYVYHFNEKQGKLVIIR